MIGDHIRTLKDGRWIHAIDCGDETVILLAGEAAQPPRVRRSYRPEFVAGAQSVEVVRHRERTFPADEVVARAYSRVVDPALAAMFRDSEAFAEWCTTGRLPAGPPNVAIAIPRAVARSTPDGEAKVKRAPTVKPSRKPKRARAAKPARKAKRAPAAKAAGKAKPTRKARPARKAPPRKGKKAAKRAARRR